MKALVYGPKFMWNLECSVGKGGANSFAADVSFIQWYYVLSADFHLTTPECKAVYRNVQITGTCNGSDSDPLVRAIIEQQKAMNHPYKDGKVSVVTGDGKVGGTSAFFLLRLEARFAIMYPNAWPRLDLIPKCPATVGQASLAAIPVLAELTQ